MTGARGVDFAAVPIQNLKRPGEGGPVGTSVMSVFRLSACAAPIVLLLSGCAALPGGGPAALDTYDLKASAPQAAGGSRARTQVLIAEPAALKALDGENIVIRPAPGSIEFLGGAQWADRLPRIVQARLVEAFQSTGRLGGVGRPGEGLAIDYQIVTELRAFEVRVDGRPRAEVRLHVKLLNDRNGTVRAARTFEAVSAVSGTGNASYVAALDRAFAEASGEVVAWALAAM